MREDIGFTSKGLSCRGWLYMPDGLTEGHTHMKSKVKTYFSYICEASFFS